MDGNALQEKVMQLGIWGCVAIITLMTVAIVCAPIPSAPIALAVLAGIIPGSFLLAHFGSEMASGSAQRIATTVLLLLGVTAIAFLI